MGCTKHFNLFLLFIVFYILASTDGANLIVKTSKGRVNGVIMNSKGITSNKMLVFKGIPYAKAPIGQLRFKAPVEMDRWRGVIILNENDKPFCPQSGTYIFKGLKGYDENCLYVNVYTPAGVQKDSKLPVMVWIHGGGFVAGSGVYSMNGPDHLVDQNVIVVTFNYRLGALGFLSLGTEDAPGNAGLKDQNLALKWVQQEIGNFGGDPEKVTIFGESAGSSSVHFHVLSEMSKGLFQRAIGESGTALAEWPFLSTGYVERAKQLASSLNCTTAEGEVKITCLQEASVEDILDSQSINLSEEERIPGNIFAFVPVLDNKTEKPFFKDELENLIKDPANKVPMIMGINEDEGISFIPSNAQFYTNILDKLDYFIPQSVRSKINNDTLSCKVEEMKQFYFNSSKPTLDNLQGYINLMTDKMFAVSTAVTAKELSKHNNNSIYLYHFDFDGGFRDPYPTRYALKLKGASHGDELGYLFVLSSVDTKGYAADSPEMKVLRKMVKLWTNFAKFGTPIQKIDTDLENTQWTPISEKATSYLIINETLTMSTENFQIESVKFWENIETTNCVSPPSPITKDLPTTPTTDTTPTATTPTATTPTATTPTATTPTATIPTATTPTATTPTATTPTATIPTETTPTATTPTATIPTATTPTATTPTATTPTATTPTATIPTATTPTATTPTATTPTATIPTATTPTATTPTATIPTETTPTATTPTATTPTATTPTATIPTATIPTATTPTATIPTATTPTATTPTATTPTATIPTATTPTATIPTEATPTATTPTATIPTATTPTPTVPPPPPPSSSSVIQFNVFLYFLTTFIFIAYLF